MGVETTMLKKAELKQRQIETEAIMKIRRGWQNDLFIFSLQP